MFVHDGLSADDRHHGLRAKTAQVVDAVAARRRQMKCSIRDCAGQYEEGKVVHTVRHRGHLVVIDGVPADVCNVCGDVLLKPDTVRRIEAILAETRDPDRTAPVYEYAS
jgi:YgiT-type zinc finger domain-containing protein